MCVCIYIYIYEHIHIGIAEDLDATLAMAGTFVGTVTYMSPERCLGEDRERGYYYYYYYYYY